MFRKMIAWTPVYTQVYDEVSNMWSCRACVDHVQIVNHFDGSYYDKDTRSVVEINEEVYKNSYTEHYYDLEWRKHQAAMGVWYGTHYYEYIKDISIYNPLEEMSLTNMPEQLFYFIRPIVVPPHTEGD